MDSALVTRNQFNVTREGVVHKPTDAAFIPAPGNPYSGRFRVGQLANQPPTAKAYPVPDVMRLMGELWEEFVTSNPEQEAKVSTKSPSSRTWS